MSILNKLPFTSGGSLGFELPINSTFGNVGFGNVRTAEFRDYNNDGIDDRDQGINIPNPNVKEYFPGFGNSISIGGPDGPRIIPGPGDGPGMSPPPVRSQQPMQQMPVANSFLEQLQQSTGLLGQQIRNTQPFATYTPTATDFVRGVPQNRFVGNQFQMPTLGLQSGEGIPVFGGTYTPLPFGSAYDMSQSNDLTPIETLLNAVSNERGGRSGDDPRGSFGFGRRGDTLSPAPGLGLAVDEYGRIRNIGIPRDMLVNTFDAMKPVTSSIGDYMKSGGLLGNLIEGIRNFVGKGNDEGGYSPPSGTTGAGGQTKRGGLKGGRRGEGGFGKDKGVGQDAGTSGGTGGRRGGAGKF